MRAALVMSLGLLAGCEPAKTSKRATEPENTPPRSTQKKGPQEYIPPPIQKKPVEKTPAERFDAAWAEAERMGKQLDEQEPAATAKAERILTQDELIQSRLWRMSAGWEQFAGNLIRLGFLEWVARESRKTAAADKDFREVARIMWVEEDGPRAILAKMNTWGAIDPAVRQLVKHDVQNGTPTLNLLPAVRNAIIDMDGEKWLRR